MQNKLHNFFTNNQELTKVISYIFIGIAVFAIVVVSFWLANRQDSHTYVDSVSGETINTLNTGAISSDGPVFVGYEQVASQMDSDLASAVKNQLQVFFHNTLPQVEKISYKKDSLATEGDTYIFTLVASDGKEFIAQLTGTTKNNYQLTLSYKGGTVLSYDALKIITPTKNPLDLVNYLPHTINQSEIPTVTVSRVGRERGSLTRYEISVNSCGDQSIKTRALELTNQWLKQKGFNPSDFNFEIPDYCDGA
ncbi:hypothetical protein IKF89_00710 [Candidatus Saccharibacteria bacterium]|nr:hypothetical protein [Candidatus Saccharibacteria bacterium]